MPNLAIYCRTTVSMDGEDLEGVNVINLIGFGFDSKKQPDFQFFKGKDLQSSDEKVVSTALHASACTTRAIPFWCL